jgi:hypothetical protein
MEDPPPWPAQGRLARRPVHLFCPAVHLSSSRGKAAAVPGKLDAPPGKVNGGGGTAYGFSEKGNGIAGKRNAPSREVAARRGEGHGTKNTAARPSVEQHGTGVRASPCLALRASTVLRTAGQPWVARPPRLSLPVVMAVMTAVMPVMHHVMRRIGHEVRRRGSRQARRRRRRWRELGDSRKRAGGEQDGQGKSGCSHVQFLLVVGPFRARWRYCKTRAMGGG